MSDFESDEHDASIELLEDSSYAFVPETEPENTYNDDILTNIDDFSDEDEIEQNHPVKYKKKKRKKVSTSKKVNSLILPFNHNTRHKSKSSAQLRTKDNQTLIIESPDNFNTFDEIRDKMDSITSNMDSYFPSIDKKSRTWNNINAIMNHAKHAYGNHNKEHEQLKEADYKISELEKKNYEYGDRYRNNQRTT